MTSPSPLRASVVVVARSGTDELRHTLDALRDQDGIDFEVVVVIVEAALKTREVVAERSAACELKAMTSAPLNLSAARNQGLAASAGEVVVFLAEGATPPPAWLETRIAGLAESDVAGVGGGKKDRRETDGCLCDRFGDPAPADMATSRDHAYPFATCFPWLSGSDSAFRRDAVVQAGGFDENFRGRLGAIDLCCRLTDSGWRLQRVCGHEIRRSAAIHQHERMNASQSPLIDLSDRLRFPLVNGRAHHDLNTIFASTSARFAAWRSRIALCVEAHQLEEILLVAFDEACDEAWANLLRGGTQMWSTRLMRTAFGDPPPFTPFPCRNTRVRQPSTRGMSAP